MKNNNPVAIVSIVLFLLGDCLIMGAVLAFVGWLFGITIGLKFSVVAGFLLLVLQLLITEINCRDE